jgi:hypothetical protein
VADLKARAVPSNDRWNLLIDLVNRPGASWDVGLINYCMAYVITGNAGYVTKAWQLMLQSMAAGNRQVSNPGHKPTMGPPTADNPSYHPPTGVHEIDGDSGYQCRNYFPAACLLYDWCWTGLNAAQRDQLRADIEVCANWVWPDTNPARKGQWAVDNPLNNYWWGFMYTWLAGLAIAGDSGQAPAFYAAGQGRWSGLALPVLQGIGKGGMLPEGTNYSVASVSFMLMQLLAHESATGETLTTPWHNDFVTAMLHLTVPTMNELQPLGDLGAGPISDTHRKALLLMARRDPRAQVWLDQVSPSRCQQRENAWFEFCFAAPATPTGEKP